jgi:predicted phosphoribosyltransferase
MTPFRDRLDAGRRLAARLVDHVGRRAVLVLAHSRDAVPVAFEVAQALGAPLDVLRVEPPRRGVPGGRRSPPDVEGRTVILVDDGLATGAAMRGAVAALRRLQPARIVLAVPTAARETCRMLRTEVDEVTCAETPVPVGEVGRWYEDASETTDDDVRVLLERSAPGRLAA